MILRRAIPMLGLSAFLAVVSACASVEDPSAMVEIAPATAEVWPGESVKFVASVAGTVDEAAEWSVLESDGGTIDAAGSYTAPRNEGTYTVQASFKRLAAMESTTVRVTRSVRVDVSPTSATLAPGEWLALSAAVSGNVKAVTWSVAEAPEGGTVTAAGVYTAPQTAGTYNVVATSAADPSKSGSTAIVVTATPPVPPPAIAIAPQSASLVAGNTLQLNVTISGLTDTSVTWSVAESGGGTVSATGLYTAPPTAGTYHVVARSRADATKSATATITVTAPVAGLMSVAQWEARYLTADAASYSGSAVDSLGVPQFCKQAIKSGNSRWAFDSWYCLNGPLHMYQATRNTAYLDRVLEYADDLIAAAVPVSQLTAEHAAALGCWGWTSTGKAACAGSAYQTSSVAALYKGWHAWGLAYDATIKGGEYPLYESNVWRHITATLVAMNADAAVYGNATYRARYDKILAFTKQNIWNKWVARGMTNIYRANTHMTGHWAQIALDLWLLSDASDAKRTEYRTVLDNIDHLGIPPGINSTWTGRSFRTQLVPNATDPLAYDLKWSWNDSVTSSEVGYANSVVRYIEQSYERDPLTQWTAADIAKLRRALVVHIWTQTAAGWHLSEKVDGSGNGAGVINSGWARLGRYDPVIQKRFESHTVGRNVEMYGIGASNAAILAGQR